MSRFPGNRIPRPVPLREVTYACEDDYSYQNIHMYAPPVQHHQPMHVRLSIPNFTPQAPTPYVDYPEIAGPQYAGIAGAHYAEIAGPHYDELAGPSVQQFDDEDEGAPFIDDDDDVQLIENEENSFALDVSDRCKLCHDTRTIQHPESALFLLQTHRIFEPMRAKCRFVNAELYDLIPSILEHLYPFLQRYRCCLSAERCSLPMESFVHNFLALFPTVVFERRTGISRAIPLYGMSCRVLMLSDVVRDQILDFIKAYEREHQYILAAQVDLVEFFAPHGDFFQTFGVPELDQAATCNFVMKVARERIGMKLQDAFFIVEYKTMVQLLRSRLGFQSSFAKICHAVTKNNGLLNPMDVIDAMSYDQTDYSKMKAGNRKSRMVEVIWKHIQQKVLGCRQQNEPGQQPTNSKQSEPKPSTSRSQKKTSKELPTTSRPTSRHDNRQRSRSPPISRRDDRRRSPSPLDYARSRPTSNRQSQSPYPESSCSTDSFNSSSSISSSYSEESYRSPSPPRHRRHRSRRSVSPDRSGRHSRKRRQSRSPSRHQRSSTRPSSSRARDRSPDSRRQRSSARSGSRKARSRSPENRASSRLDQPRPTIHLKRNPNGGPPTVVFPSNKRSIVIVRKNPGKRTRIEFKEPSTVQEAPPSPKKKTPKYEEAPKVVDNETAAKLAARAKRFNVTMASHSSAVTVRPVITPPSSSVAHSSGYPMGISSRNNLKPERFDYDCPPAYLSTGSEYSGRQVPPTPPPTHQELLDLMRRSFAMVPPVHRTLKMVADHNAANRQELFNQSLLEEANAFGIPRQSSIPTGLTPPKKKKKLCTPKFKAENNSATNSYSSTPQISTQSTDDAPTSVSMESSELNSVPISSSGTDESSSGNYESDSAATDSESVGNDEVESEGNSENPNELVEQCKVEPISEDDSTNEDDEVEESQEISDEMETNDSSFASTSPSVSMKVDEASNPAATTASNPAATTEDHSQTIPTDELPVAEVSIDCVFVNTKTQSVINHVTVEDHRCASVVWPNPQIKCPPVSGGETGTTGQCFHDLDINANSTASSNVTDQTECNETDGLRTEMSFMKAE